jgi:signal transduction histidine kinase
MTRLLDTQFASAERASQSDIDAWRAMLNHLPLLVEFADAIPNVVMVLNQQRQVIFANRALLDLTGGNPDAILGLRPGEILDCVHAAETHGGCGTTEFCQTCGAVRAILSSLKGHHDVQECRIIRRNGEALDLRVWATPLILHDETLSLFAVHDISDEKRRQALERIFFHDILNVAGIVMGYSQLLENSAQPQNMDQIADIIVRATHRLVDEIRSQQALLAAENGELTVRPAMLNSLKVLHNVKLFYDGHQATQDGQIVIAPDAQDVAFISDTILLERVLGNMTKNALEASAPGQTVTLSCGTTGDQVWFEVHNASYMRRETQLQVFQRSFSTKGSGRGLGTYSVKLLTERYLKGTVSFTSSPEQGTTFRVTYPMTLE